MTLTKRIEFCFGHRLLNYSGACKNCHGHNATLEVTFIAPKQDAHGFVLDFGIAKEVVKGWVDEHWDHAFLVNKFDKAMLAFLVENDQKHYVVVHPLDAIGQQERIALSNPTMENLSRILLQELRQHIFLKGYDATILKVRIYESPNGWVENES